MGRKKMCVLATYAPEAVLPFAGDYHKEWVVGDFHLTVNMDSPRYRLFAKSLTCAQCGLVGSQMRLEYSWHPKGWIEPHFNLYGILDGISVLMTKDHIIPKSRGGKNHDSNLQTMCDPCNCAKGSRLDEELQTVFA